MLLVVAAKTFKLYRKFYCKLYCTCDRSIKVGACVLMQGALTSRADWMRRHRLRTLRNICLPGSHQSATYTVESTERHLPLAIGWTRCQRYDISEQLEAGIRFIDVSVTSAREEGDGEVRI